MSLTLPIPLSISVTNASVNSISDLDNNNYILINNENENDIKCYTNDLLALRIDSLQRIGINKYNPNRQVDINSSTGECLRLSNNAPNGSAVNYTDFSVNSSGELIINPSGTITSFIGSISINSLILNDDTVVASGAQINYLDVGIGHGVANKAIVLDNNRNYDNINHLTVKSLTVLDGVNSDIVILKVNTTTSTKQAEINSSTGDCLRLSNNAPTGNADNYCDFNVSADGILSILPSGGKINIPALAIKQIIII